MSPNTRKGSPSVEETPLNLSRAPKEAQATNAL